MSFGAQSVVVEECRQDNQAEQEIFGQSEELWDTCNLIAHFELEHDIEATISTARDILELPDVHYSIEPVGSMEWNEQIKASYIPLKVADGLYIIPEWSEPEDLNAINIRLQPGIAFGTGEHPTTRLCLKHLLSANLKGCHVMDYGTGSGVLAIGALLLGAARAVGTDTDPLAVRVAAQNAKLNGVEEDFDVYKCEPSIHEPDPLQQSSWQGHQFDLVVANILFRPLLELQPRLTSYCKPGGRLLVSGILQEQAAEIMAAYEADFEDFEVVWEGSWACVTAVKQR
eukprot:jgi/Chrzof1/5517/Cz16g06020.t1